MDGWNTSFLLRWPIFRCELLVSGRVTSWLVNLSHPSHHFWVDDFPFPKGYVIVPWSPDMDHLPTWKVKNGHMNKGKMAGYRFPSHGSNWGTMELYVFFSGGHFFIVESVLNPQNSPQRSDFHEPTTTTDESIRGWFLGFACLGVMIFVKKNLPPIII